MASKDHSYVNPVDAIVHDIADTLTKEKSFRSLCDAALGRRGRTAFHGDLTRALVVFSKSIQKQSLDVLHGATAWMLRGCRTAIALRICENISPERFNLDLLISSTNQSYSGVHQAQLVSFINKKFTVSDQLSMEIAQAWQGAHRKATTLDDEYLDDPREVPPDLDLFLDFDKVKPILCSGAAHKDLCDQIKTSLFPSPKDLIRDIISENVPLVSYENQKWCIAGVIEWHMLEYFRDENINLENIESIFTISGSLNTACVMRLADYLVETWSTGAEMLELVKVVLQQFLMNSQNAITQSIGTTIDGVELEIQPSSPITKEQAFVKLSGSYSQITARLEQLAWLAATLRPPFEGQLTVSDITLAPYRMQGSTVSSLLQMPTIFHLSLFDQSRALAPNGESPGQCWTSVCSESILAHNFPVPMQNHQEGAIGLYIPFDIMAAFAGVRYPILSEGRLVFASRSCALIPEKQFNDDSIQWHFLKSKDWLKQLGSSKWHEWDSRLQTLNVPTLTHSKAFLGYSKHSEVLLGTAEFEYVNSDASGLPRTSDIVFHWPENSFCIEIDKTGNAIGLDGKTWKFNRSESALATANELAADDRFQRAMQNSALLYDQNSSIAFLVSELSFALHLAAVYLRTHSELKRQRIPLAEIDADGGQAALIAIMRAKDLMVNFADGPSRRYTDIVEKFLDVIDQRKTQALTHRLYDPRPCIHKGLRGWDHIDLQARRFEVFESSLNLTGLKPLPIWWDLFQTSHTLVVFTRLSKAPIRNLHIESDHTKFSCSSWDDIPNGEHILMAPVTQLRRLRSALRHDQRSHPTRYMLNDKLAWARPTSSRLFEQNCKQGGTCNPLQTMVRMNVAEANQKAIPRADFGHGIYHQHPGSLENTGVVLFADKPGSFEARRCWRDPKPRAKSRSDWNYPFIAASFLVVVLAWWNSTLIILGVILFGAAYTLR